MPNYTDVIIPKEFLHNSDRAFLISFPRCGSHYLRMLCEFAFRKPTLPRVFCTEFFPEVREYKPDDFLFRHSHEHIFSSRMIYLFRFPVDVVYSYLIHIGVTFDEESVANAAREYAAHYEKIKNVDNVLYIEYSNLLLKPFDVFDDLAAFLGCSYQDSLLAEGLRTVTREFVRNKTAEGYEHPVIAPVISGVIEMSKRKEFKQRYGKMILDICNGIHMHVVEERIAKDTVVMGW